MTRYDSRYNRGKKSNLKRKTKLLKRSRSNTKVKKRLNQKKKSFKSPLKKKVSQRTSSSQKVPKKSKNLMQRRIIAKKGTLKHEFRSGLKNDKTRVLKSALKSKYSLKPKYNIRWSPKVKHVERIGIHSPPSVKRTFGNIKWSFPSTNSHVCTGTLNAKTDFKNNDIIIITIDNKDNKKPVFRLKVDGTKKKIKEAFDAHYIVYPNDNSSLLTNISFNFDTVNWVERSEKIRKINEKGFNIGWFNGTHRFNSTVSRKL